MDAIGHTWRKYETRYFRKSYSVRCIFYVTGYNNIPAYRRLGGNMNISELKRSLPVLLKNKVTAFLWGAQGVGKTQVVQQIAQEGDYGFRHLHLATQEVGDLVGLLVVDSDGTVRHARPEWFPTEGKGIIFLDELNRAHPDVLQAMFSFITSGTIHRHTLPEGWRIVAAGNYQSSMFNVTDTSDAAWMSRFCHIDFNPTAEEFIMYVESRGMFDIADFIRDMPDMLEVKQKERLNMSMITPDRRAWADLLGKLDFEADIEQERYEIYSGLVGTAAASAYLTSKKKSLDKIRGRDILNMYDKVRARVLKVSDPKSTRFDLLEAAFKEISLFYDKETLTLDQMNNFKEFMLDVPLELNLRIVNQISESSWKQKNEILNSPDFAKAFAHRKLK